MKIVTPRGYRGINLPTLFQVDMNEFDVERLLPTLFFIVMTNGRIRGSLVNPPEDLASYVRKLQTHQRIRGFEGPGGERLLEKWVRTSVVRVSRAGRTRE